MIQASLYFYEEMEMGPGNFPLRIDDMPMSKVDVESIRSTMNQPKEGGSDIAQVFYNAKGKLVQNRCHGANIPKVQAKMLFPLEIPAEWKPQLPKNLWFHFHPFCEITQVISGRACYICDNQFIEVKTGDIVIFNPNMPHFWYPDREQPAYIKVLNFYPNLMLIKGVSENYDQCVKHLFYSDHTYYYLNGENRTTQDVCRLLGDLSFEYNQGACGWELFAESIILHISSLLIRNLSNHENILKSNRTSLKPLIKALDYIDTNFSSSLTLDQIAKTVNMNPCYFSSYFKKNMQMPLTDYLNKVRIDNSITMLKNTDLNITEIGMMCGFSSITSFYRAFKKFHGSSPKDYLLQIGGRKNA